MKNKNYKTSIFTLLLCTCFNSLVTNAQTKIVTINKSKQFQKIDGFGAYGLNKVEWTSPPYFDDKFVSDYVDDLGATISRCETYSLENSNDNNDPFVADMNKVTPNKFNVAYWDFAKKAQALASKNGDTIKFFYSVWSPPAWMKYVNSLTGTDGIWNRLIANDYTPPSWNTFVLANKPDANPDDYKQEFVEHCLIHTRLFKEKTGLDLYAFSLQNELAFAQPFQSCVYSPEQYRQLLKVAGPRFRKEFPKLKMMMHEDIGDLGRFRQFMDAVTRDTTAVKYQDIGACHAYNSTGTLAGSTSASTWDGMYRVTNARKPTPFWQTETSGYGTGWEGGLGLAKAIYIGLKFGKVAAWVWWAAGESSDEAESIYSLITNNVKSKRYYTMKHFARYIRPNAVSVEATCASDVDILPLAFQHNTKKTLTVVLINQSNVEKTIKLSFADQGIAPANYKIYQSNNSDNCADKGTLAANAELKIPANTLVTLVGEGSEPVITSNDNAAEQENNNLFEIHPNPSANYTIVEFKSNNISSNTIEVLDAYSKLVKSVPLTYGTNEINTSDLSDGIYFVKIGNSTKKLIINK